MPEPIARRVPLATGLNYNLLEWDSPSDHTIVLLHGFLDNAWTWEGTVEAGLAGRAHLVAPDWRGHGDSDWIGAGGYYHFLDYVADLASLIERVGRERVSLVGHSMGGMVTAYFCATFPERVDRLVMIEGLGPREGTLDPARVGRWVKEWHGARNRGSRSYASLDEAAARLRQTDPELDGALARRLAETGTRADPDGRLRFKHDPLHVTHGPYPFTVEAARRFWRAITAPALLIDGGLSPQLADAAARRAAFPDARHAVVEGAGHSVHRHRPAQVAKLVIDHLFRQDHSPVRLVR
jgi:pimeloyl-ACP methyl ester carboxylesterase